jgi:hypothetical protein
VLSSKLKLKLVLRFSSLLLTVDIHRIGLMPTLNCLTHKSKVYENTTFAAFGMLNQQQSKAILWNTQT